MISIRLRGITFRIYFSFLVFNALIFLIRDSRLMLAFYTACAVHEAGHIAALSLVGGRIRSAALSGAGIRIDTVKSCIMSVKRSIFVLVAGPAANLAVYLLFMLTDRRGIFPMLNLMGAVYNMLPYRSLDGGGIIAKFTAGASFERPAENFLTAVKLTFIVLSAVSVFICGKAALPLLIASAVLYAGDRSSF